MTTFSDFAQHDSVAHITLGDGVVCEKDNTIVTVRFERRYNNGPCVVGKYDQRWFEINPKFLSHRSKPGKKPDAAQAGEGK